MFGKLLFGIATLLLLLSLGLSKVSAQPVVVPNANEFVEGDGFNSFPFNTFKQIRYQQIYESTQFLQCGNIIQLKFRLDEDRSGFNSTIPDILIQLSTTTTTPATLSSTFASNIGPNVTTVFNGELTLSAADCGSIPCPFDIMINLRTPFNYDPSQGNLLLDVTKQESLFINTFYDAVENATSITRRVFNVGDATAETGTVDDTGLVTQFVCEVPTSVPTLSEWGLIAMAGILGIVGLMVMRRRKVTA